MGVKEKKNQKEGGQLPFNPALKARFDASRPQFHKTPSKDVKIELDDRFASVFSDPNFQLQVVDKYGRKQKGLQKEIATNELEEFYTKEDKSDLPKHNDCDLSPSLHLPTRNRSTAIEHGWSKVGAGRQDTVSKAGISDDSTTRIAYLTALSRGKVEFSPSSEEADEKYHVDGHNESDDDDYPNLHIESDTLGVLDPSFRTIEDVPVEFTTIESPYVAVTNADWSYLRAVDIFAIVSSFVPLGMVLRVTVYPSNFGMERLRKEEHFGPVDVWKSNQNGNDVPSTIVDFDNDGIDDPIDDIQSDSVLDSTNDFDPEKLRLYEASRLKYYFAVVEFANARFADIAYREIDGMEFEHSSAALDLRIIPVDDFPNIVANRKMRDEASALPSSYSPPDFVVNALQQSSVHCTWDIGDRNRESLLTKYSVSGRTWENVAENEALKMYLGSDQSSDDNESFSGERKSSKLRNMLGLDSDIDDDKSDADTKSENTDVLVSEDDERFHVKQASFIPGKLDRTDVSIEHEKELTPWEKYQEKRRQKRREKRAASREKRKQANDERKRHFHFGKAERNSVLSLANGHELLNPNNVFRPDKSEENLNEPSLAGSIDDDKRDFDMRGLERVEKNKVKQLKGARRRNEERFAVEVVGKNFQVNTLDERFKKVLEGTDERFGIDRTDPSFKETPAMRQILEEQSRHRKRHRASQQIELFDNVADDTVDVAEHAFAQKSDSSTLGALVVSIKAKIKE